MKCPKCHSENAETARFCSHCAAALTAADEAQPSFTATLETSSEELIRGTQFAGRYEIIEELGKGGMGRVYRVEDKKLKQEVALKLIAPEIARDRKTVERFQNELKSARMIAHKNVCRMFDMGESGEAHFITMEYVRGEDLRSMIRMSGQLGIGTAINITKQICEGLSEAHRLGVVHRDLKSSNIMIDKAGNARIMDFGIARSVEAKKITGAGVIIGTPEYMSPEQVEGKETDQRSDIYSLGVILYEMVTGRVPFEGDSPFTIGIKHKSELPQDPRELNSRLPADLSRLILKCLEKAKESRFQSASEVRSELERMEHGMPTTQREAPKKRKPLTSKEITVSFNIQRLLIPGLGIVALAAAVVLLFIFIPRGKTVLAPTDKPSLAVMYFRNLTGDDSLDFWQEGISSSIITDLEQSRYIDVLSMDRLYSILGKLDLLGGTNYATEDLKKVAAEGRVNHILTGTLAKAGETFRISYKLQKAGTGETVGTERLEGVGEGSLFRMVDELTLKVKKDLRLSSEQIAGDIDERIGTITTSSPEAFKYYLEARKYHYSHETLKAEEMYKRAVEIDPEFSTAYRSMGNNYANMGYRSEWRRCLQKAMEFGDRVSAREFLTTRMYFYRLSERTYALSIETARKFMELYPNIGEPYNSLGNLYQSIEEWDKADEAFRVPVQNKFPEYYFPYGNLASTYRYKGMYDKAIECFQDIINQFGDEAGRRRNLARTYLCMKRFEQAVAELDKAFRLDPMEPSYFIRGEVFMYQGDLVEAENEFKKLTESESVQDRRDGIEGIIYLYQLQGRFAEALAQAKLAFEISKEENQLDWELHWRQVMASALMTTKRFSDALEELDKAFDLGVELETFNRQRDILFLKGLTLHKMGALEEVKKNLARLKALIDEGMNKKHMRYYYHLMGLTALEEGRIPEAMGFFDKAVSLLPAESNSEFRQALFVDALAFAHYNNGDLEKARDNYEKIAAMTRGRLYCNDVFARSFLMLGKVHEQMGSKAKAVEYYKIFLELWNDADPGLPEVDEAKKRLEADFP